MFDLTNIAREPGLLRVNSTRSEIITSEWRENMERRRRSASLNEVPMHPCRVDDMICSAPNKSTQQVTSHPVHEVAGNNTNRELNETAMRSSVATCKRSDKHCCRHSNR